MQFEKSTIEKKTSEKKWSVEFVLFLVSAGFRSFLEIPADDVRKADVAHRSKKKKEGESFCARAADPPHWQQNEVGTRLGFTHSFTELADTPSGSMLRSNLLPNFEGCDFNSEYLENNSLVYKHRSLSYRDQMDLKHQEAAYH